MRLKRNILVVLAFFLLIVLLAKAAEDEQLIDENKETVDLNEVNADNNIENSITHENIQTENQNHHAATASFGVYLNIVN